MRWMLYQLLIMILLPWLSETTDPRFDHNEQINLLLIPADTEVGSVIYRLVASDTDFDYPLQFELLGDISKSVIMIETLPCTKYNSVCQANVILQKKLEIGRNYDFKVIARDTKGGKCILLSNINATNAITRKELIFPKIPTVIVVSEDARRGTDLDTVIARKNPLNSKPVVLELHKSPNFGIRQRLLSNNDTKGTIFLLNRLDYEKQSMHHLILCANNPYVNQTNDNRNIACSTILIIVNDVQDMPPVFVQAPPVTKLDNTLFPGDVIARVKAEDGDRGDSRDIRYGLISEGNPFIQFFNITDTTGEIILLKSLDEISAISHHGVPILLTVLAEEVKRNSNEPETMTSTVELAFILDERGNEPPYFENENYVSNIDENAVQGTMLTFQDPYIPQVKDESIGKNGIFSLSLINNNGTFEITPNVAERSVQFSIKVRDNTLLDYETTKTLQFSILAQELGPVSNLSSTANVLVYLNDINDNIPKFMQEKYEVEFPENVTAQTKLVQIKATDIDSGLYGKIRYTQILGNLNSSLNLDPETGWITITTNSHGFDCEVQEDYNFYVEVSDENGNNNSNRETVPLIFHVLDVNDEIPKFDKSLYEFVLNKNGQKFTTPAFVKAIDRDVQSPNNLVNYEIIYGNYGNKFFLNRETGELIVNENSGESNTLHFDLQMLTIRAYDLGIPHLSSTTQIHIYTSDSRFRNMVFIIPGNNLNRQEVERTLATVTGGQVHIQDIRPFDKNIGDDNIIATDMTYGDLNKEKSIVFANVAYNKNSVIDLDQLKRTLIANQSSKVTTMLEENTYRRYKDETNLLFWLLILLALLFLLTLISLICCCICRGCPLFIAPKMQKNIRISSIENDINKTKNEEKMNEYNLHKRNFDIDTKMANSNDEWIAKKMRNEILGARLSDSKTKPTQWEYNHKISSNRHIPKISHDYDNVSFIQENLILPNQTINNSHYPSLKLKKINDQLNETRSLPVWDNLIVNHGTAEIMQLCPHIDVLETELSDIQKNRLVHKNNELFKQLLFNKNPTEKKSQYFETQSLPEVSNFDTKKQKILNSKTNFGDSKYQKSLIRWDSDAGIYKNDFYLMNRLNHENKCLFEKPHSERQNIERFSENNTSGEINSKKIMRKRKSYNETKTSLLRRNLTSNDNTETEKNYKIGNNKNEKRNYQKSDHQEEHCINKIIKNNNENNCDSRIGMMNSLMKNLKRTNTSAIDKKSVFTITYDGIQTKQIDNIPLP